MTRWEIEMKMKKKMERNMMMKMMMLDVVGNQRLIETERTITNLISAQSLQSWVVYGFSLPSQSSHFERKGKYFGRVLHLFARLSAWFHYYNWIGRGLPCEPRNWRHALSFKLKISVIILIGLCMSWWRVLRSENCNWNSSGQKTEFVIGLAFDYYREKGFCGLEYRIHLS